MARRQAIETFEERQELLNHVMQFGLDEAVERFNVAEEVIFDILRDGGMSDETIQILSESNAFRSGTFANGTATVSPELNQAIQNVQTIAADTHQTISDSVAPILDNFGQTPDTSQAGDRFTDIAQGLLPGQQTRDDVFRTMLRDPSTRQTRVVTDRATDILNSRGTVGMNDLARTVTTSADIVATGGATDKTDALFKFGAALLESNGFTPEVQQVFDFALDSLNNGLPTPELDAAIAKVNGIIDSEGAQGAGIIPINEFLGYARADAANSAMQLARTAQEDATRRGLINGPVTNSGVADAASEGILANEGATTFAAVSENQRLRAQAVQSSFGHLTNLLGLQRNDPRIASFAQLLGSSIQASTANIQTGAQLGVDAAALENERLNIGLQGVLGGSQIFANREAGAFQSLLGAGNLETARQGMAADGLAQLTNERFMGAQGLLETSNQETGNYFNAVNALLGSSNQNINANIANSNTLLQNQQQQMNAFMASLGLSADITQNATLNQFRGTEQLGNFAVPFLNFSSGALAGGNQMAAGQADIEARPSWWMNMIQSAIPAAINVASGAVGLPFGTNTNTGYDDPAITGG